MPSSEEARASGAGDGGEAEAEELEAAAAAAAATATGFIGEPHAANIADTALRTAADAPPRSERCCCWL